MLTTGVKGSPPSSWASYVSIIRRRRLTLAISQKWAENGGERAKVRSDDSGRAIVFAGIAGLVVFGIGK